MKRIYLSSPMTGLHGLNFAAFHAMTTNLRAEGHTVTNPAELNPTAAPGTTACAATSSPQWNSVS